ncbi:unnamed protein product [Didymodactylos carnosus]|nr:unnamed protein product [Didymodactylos carnosus]CAF3585309.1 unnamed protein product [Didymodactylos carnosus]
MRQINNRNTILIASLNEAKVRNHIKAQTKPVITTTEHKQQQRHSLRLTQKQRDPALDTLSFKRVSLNETMITKSVIEVPRWRVLSTNDVKQQCNDESDIEEEKADDILARHYKNKLEEQKDRKLYERWVKNQRALRKIQCRRTHTQSLTEQTRQKLLRQLVKEQKIFINDKICTKLAKYSLVFEYNIENTLSSNYRLIDWKSFESILTADEANTELDIMIHNLKAVRLTTVPHKSTSLEGSKRSLPVRERLHEKVKKQPSLNEKSRRFDSSLKKRTRSNEKENCGSVNSHSYITRQTSFCYDSTQERMISTIRAHEKTSPSPTLRYIPVCRARCADYDGINHFPP